MFLVHSVREITTCLNVNTMQYVDDWHVLVVVHRSEHWMTRICSDVSTCSCRVSRDPLRFLSSVGHPMQSVMSHGLMANHSLKVRLRDWLNCRQSRLPHEMRFLTKRTHSSVSELLGLTLTLPCPVLFSPGEAEQAHTGTVCYYRRYYA